MLEIHDLTKRYNGIPALDGVSFSIRPGEILFQGLDARQHPVAFQRLIGYVPFVAP